MALIRHLAALRPGPMTSPTASAKAALRALARRWLTLDAEIKSHDADLDALTAACAPTLEGGSWHVDWHGGRDADPGRRQSRAHPLGSGLCQAVRRLSHSGLERQDHRATGSTAAAIVRPMRLSIVWSLSGCAAIHPPSPTSVDERQKVRARWRSFAVSSALSHERSSAISAAPTGLPQRSLPAS